MTFPENGSALNNKNGKQHFCDLGVFLGDVLQFRLRLGCHLPRCLQFLLFLTHFFFLSGDLQQRLHLNREQTRPKMVSKSICISTAAIM